MAEQAADTEGYRWTPTETKQLIRFRKANAEEFMKSNCSAKLMWEKLLRHLGLEGRVSVKKISKKWDNLKQKYKEVQTQDTGSDTEASDSGVITWQYFEEMQKAMGNRPSTDPPLLVASFQESPPQILVKQEVVEGEESAPTTDVNPGASTPLFPAKKRKMTRNDILDFLEEEAEKAEKRHQETEAKTERFLALFEKLVDKL